MQPTADTVRLIWEGVIGADRMCRYYGYLTDRLSRLGELLTIGTVSFSLGAVLTILNRLPEWVSLVAISVAAVAGVVMAVGRYPQKAARSSEVYRALGHLATEWDELWWGVYEKDDTELRTEWGRLSRRQRAVLDRVPGELPVWDRLAPEVSARPTNTGRNGMLPHKGPGPQSTIRPEYPPRHTPPPPPPRPPGPKPGNEVEQGPPTGSPRARVGRDPEF